MSLYGDYIAEREGLNIYETAGGFATYKINGNECYIIDIYVKPELRKAGVASDIANVVSDRAKKQGCKYLTGSVDPRTNSATDSVKVLLSYEMNIHSIQGNLVFFIKEL